MIVEYSFVTENGETHAPPWLSDSGYFQNPDDLRLIGMAQEADLQQFSAIGDVVGLTTDLLPDKLARQRGLSVDLFEIISRELQFDQGTVDLTLLQTSWGS
jgi:hypothetical protein